MQYLHTAWLLVGGMHKFKHQLNTVAFGTGSTGRRLVLPHALEHIYT